MKKHTLIFLLLLLLSCSTNSGNSDSSTPPPPEPNQSELSKYAIGECSDFVKFDPHNLTFLNFLISKGYDLNKDSKISCDEAFKITMLDLGDSGYVTNLIGIESINQ